MICMMRDIARSVWFCEVKRISRLCFDSSLVQAYLAMFGMLRGKVKAAQLKIKERLMRNFTQLSSFNFFRSLGCSIVLPNPSEWVSISRLSRTSSSSPCRLNHSSSRIEKSPDSRSKAKSTNSEGSHKS